MARKKTLSDDAVLDGALAVMRKSGPDGVTFASVSAETGLSGSTLVQRHGSKRALLQAALLRAWDQLDERTAHATDGTPLTPAGAIGILLALSGDYAEGDDHADGLLVLREDFKDSALRARGVRWGERLAEALGRCLADETGDRPDLGRLMAAVWQGSLVWWGFSRDGALRAHMERELAAFCRAIGKA